MAGIKKRKEPKEENNRLKRMYVNSSLVHEALKDAVKKTLMPTEKNYPFIDFTMIMFLLKDHYIMKAWH